MKVCSRCKCRKSLTEFNAHCRTKDGLNSSCKDCNRKAGRHYYQQNSDIVKARAKARHAEQRRYLGNVAKEIKERFGCRFCGERLLCVLDFHHVVKSKQTLWQAAESFPRFERELNKCVVVCANCHRKIHAGLLSCDVAMIIPMKIPRIPRKLPKRATPAQQTILAYKGKKKTLLEWGAEYGLTWKLLRQRMQAGWGIEKILTTPRRAMKKRAA